METLARIPAGVFVDGEWDEVRSIGYRQSVTRSTHQPQGAIPG